MTDDFDPDLDLDELLERQVTRFERAVRDRYETADDGRFVWRLADRIAQLMESTVSNLSDAEYAAMWRTTQADLTRLELFEDVEFAVQARLARKIPSTATMAGRFFELLRLVAQASPPEPVLRFVRRTSRSYVLGLVPECLVMCRAGFENALNARYLSEGIRYPTDFKGRQTMRVRLEDAVKRKWLEADSAKQGLQIVWGRGNTAAHEDPDAVGNPLEAIAITMKVIEQLHRADPKIT